MLSWCLGFLGAIDIRSGSIIDQLLIDGGGESAAGECSRIAANKQADAAATWWSMPFKKPLLATNRWTTRKNTKIRPQPNANVNEQVPELLTSLARQAAGRLQIK